MFLISFFVEGGRPDCAFFGLPVRSLQEGFNEEGSEAMVGAHRCGEL